MTGLYLHVPFCRQKCSYCDFVSIPGRSGSLDPYVSAAAAEMRRYAGRTINTLYLGGGTPSVLSPRHIAELRENIAENYTLRLEEATTEANPESLDPERLAAFRDAGIDRLSIGVQSLDDDELRFLGRIHSAADAARALASARDAGFGNVSVDLIYGLPGQSMDGWLKTLDGALAFGLQHISLYPLTIEDGTPFASRGVTVDQDLQAEMYERSHERLEKAGFRHYEISSWAKPGFECRHNLAYWRNREYLGIGPSAASYLDGCRFTNCADLDEYLRRSASGEDLREENEIITPERGMSDGIMLGLRCCDGIALTPALEEKFGQTIDAFVGQKLLARREGTLRLTEKGMLVSNRILCEFI